MSDFIDSIKVDQSQLHYTKQNGLEKGLTKTFLDNINRLSVNERPLHCTDVKRETLYIKEHDEWSKKDSRAHLKEALERASIKNYRALKDWQDENPDFMHNDKKSDFYARAVIIFGSPLNKVDNKIIKNICKETYVKNDVN